MHIYGSFFLMPKESQRYDFGSTKNSACSRINWNLFLLDLFKAFNLCGKECKTVLSYLVVVP
ncbi:hypothetical protein J2X31_001647 [Flavobacterium arsenatis]|uniref:Uncharacterized protein n=1 Tax=Flavobacterium arsenatis TaxID=1484332 RepID=A0ABU1TNW1_9FLAO|nr:hypothetical protein [Flavobacterium arsenatis]